MSDFLQQVSSFLNLNKLVAITLPGVIATLALVLFFIPVPCRKDSQSCWYCMGESNKEEVSKPNVGAPPRPRGTYMVSKLSWEQANQSYKTLAKISPTNLTTCAQLPEYIVSSSRLKSEKETVKNLGDLVAVDPGSLLEDLDRCNMALSAAQAQVATRDAAESSVISTLTANVNDLNTALEKAKATANPALERSLTAKLEETRKALERELCTQSDLKATGSAATTLVNQVSDSRKAITSDVSAAIPVEAPTKTTWAAAVQGLGSHILIFLLVSIMVGQLLDPIQRVLVSWDPIRGVAFPFLNRLYRADQPIAGVRFGDQRYPGTRSPDIKSLLERDPHLFEPSYAIGKGLLTQAEFNSLQDDFYRESQISTGLILPLLMLASAIYIRLLCCGVVNVGWRRALPLAFITFVWLLFLLASAVYHLSSPTRLSGLTKKGKRVLGTYLLWVIPLLFATHVSVLVGLNYVLLKDWRAAVLVVGLPTLQVICLVAGMDRLHNFYSNVQARIVGAAKKQEESQIKKFADILTDPKPKQSFIEELGNRDKEIKQILGPLTGEVPQIERAVDLLTDPKMHDAFVKELRKRREKIDDLLRPLGGEP